MTTSPCSTDDLSYSSRGSNYNKITESVAAETSYLSKKKTPLGLDDASFSGSDIDLGSHGADLGDFPFEVLIEEHNPWADE